jgi:hypothetical protein
MTSSQALGDGAAGWPQSCGEPGLHVLCRAGGHRPGPGGRGGQGHRSADAGAGGPPGTARAGGLPRWRATRSPHRSAPPAPDRRRGTCTCSPSTPRSGSPPRNRTARRAGASNADGRSLAAPGSHASECLSAACRPQPLGTQPFRRSSRGCRSRWWRSSGTARLPCPGGWRAGCSSPAGAHALRPPARPRGLAAGPRRRVRGSQSPGTIERPSSTTPESARSY